MIRNKWSSLLAFITFIILTANTFTVLRFSAGVSGKVPFLENFLEETAGGISDPIRDDDKKILVVYSGPSSSSERKHELYQRNLEFFMEHGGVNCQNHDTLIVVGKDFYYQYLEKVEEFNAKCGNEHKVVLVTRRHVCYDMETARLALFGGAGLNIQNYDYFIFINCGVTGPGVPLDAARPWTDLFISKFTDVVKMTGLTMHCLPPRNTAKAHIQSMMYALDRTGIQLVMESNVVYDCIDRPVEANPESVHKIIKNYEIGMGQAIINAGYGISPLIGAPAEFSVLTKHNRENCTVRDLWMESRLKEFYGGRVPSLEETVFFKTSRFLPKDIAKQINYTGKIFWKWP